MNQKNLLSALLMAVIFLVTACSTDSTDTPDAQAPESPFSKTTRVLNLTPSILLFWV